MTWNMLYYAVFLVRHFASEIQSMAFEFEVEVTGVQGLAAKGNLSRIARFWS